ncbi:CU044_2847 family protein [Streptomyces sp. NPDC048172]|uniref:CU044_2847 family protein n=1 Tax=Streptomyces sp. NPDC048172 TaxID=3365505 RepID=UPI00371BB61B
MHVVEIPLEGGDGGDVVRVEIRDTGKGGPVPVGRGGERVAARASRSLGAMLGTVAPVAQSFVERFRELPDPPDEMTVDFGVTLSAQADLVVANSAAEANFSVSLTWHRSDGGQPARHTA